VGDLITVLLLAPGQNTDLIGTYNAYTLFGTNSNGGVHDFTLSNMTLDGNYGNETVGSCFVDYGYRFKIQHVTMRNCATYGWRTAYGPSAPLDGSHNMEADIDDVHILKSGGHGVWFAGPHDSVLKNVTVVMASCAANNTSSGIFNDANGGFRGIAIHPWADSGTCPNLPRWALYDTGGGLNITASHFEGAVTGAAYIGGNSSTFDTSNDYYTVTGVPEDIIVVAGASNQVGGWVNDSYSLGQYGVAVTGSGNNINLVGGAKAGMIDFTSDPGGNNYIVSGGTVTADYTGAFPATDNIQLSTYRSGQHNYTQVAGTVTTPGLPTSAGGGGLYICVDSTGTQYKKASCP
jgi:hypothetical protein